MNTVILNNTTDYHCGSALVMSNLRALLIEYGFDVSAWVNEYDLEASRIKRSDFVVINGEGTFHHSSGSDRLKKMLELCRGKKAVMVNSTWDNIKIPNIDVLQSMPFIAVRESRSYKQITQVVDESKVYIVPDLSLLANLGHKIGGGGVGYGDSVVGNISLSLREMPNCMPMQRGISTSKYIEWLEGLDLYVTGRFHGVCLAALLAVPFLAMPSNSHKIEGILEDMNCSELLITDVGEVEAKQEIAKEKIVYAEKYAITAATKIHRFFAKVRRAVIGKDFDSWQRRERVTAGAGDRFPVRYHYPYE